VSRFLVLFLVVVGSLHLNVVPGCKLRQQPAPYQGALARRVGRRYNVVGLSPTSADLEEYPVNAQVGFPVYAVDRSHLPKGFNADVTLRTLLVRPEGTVAKVWVGAYFEERKAEMETFFKIRLPGISEAPQRAAK
jgi:hypothetical protein